MSAQYKIYNGPAPTVAAQLALTTGTVIETHLQVKGVTAVTFKIKAWGVSMKGAAAAAGPQWELIETGTIFATITQHVAAGIVAWNAEALNIVSTTYFDVSTTTSTGFNASAEGTIVASRVFDTQFIQPTGERAWEFSLGNEPVVSAVSALRIRSTAAAAVDALCWVLVEV